MNRSRSPHRGSSHRHSNRSRSPERSRNHGSSSRRSRSPRRDRHSDHRRSPSPSHSRRNSDRRRSYRSDNSDGSRERGRVADEKSSRSSRNRDGSPGRSSRDSNYERKEIGSDSRAADHASGSGGGRQRQSRWESEPFVELPVPPPPALNTPAALPAVPMYGVAPPLTPVQPAEATVRPAPPSAAADPSDALKKLAAMQPAPLQPAQMTRIYVGNVYRELSEAEIQTVFEAFGPVRSCKFIPNPENGVGKHKGFGFIEYVDPAAAHSAVQAMNGFTLAGRAVKVGWAHSASLSASSSVDLHQVAAM